MIAEEDLAGGRVLRLQAGMIPIRHLSLALLTGGLLTLAYPGWEIAILAWVALAPLMLAAARERTGPRAFGLGVIAGTFFYYASSWWLTYSPINYGGFAAPLAYALLLLPTVVCSLFTGLFATIVNVSVRRSGAAAVLVAPLVWVALEWLRLRTLGIGWNFLGYSQSFQPALAQSASIGGVYAISLLLAMASAALAYSAIAPSRKAALRVLTVTLAVFVVNLVAGLYITSRVQVTTDDGLPVVALQPNISPSIIESSRQQVFDGSYVHLARMGRAELDRENAPVIPAPALIVWPEMPANFVYDDEPEARRLLAAVARQRGDYVFVNALGVVGDGHSNSAVLVGPDGTRVGQYDKVRLLPFGEYVPLRGVVPFVDRIPSLMYDFTPGESVRLVDVEGVRIGTSICFESAFPELAREARRAGATAFINLTNDAWFGPTPMPRQHLAHSVMRSIENGVDQIRVTNAGYSARISPTGQILDSTDLFVETSRRWELPRSAPPMTVYARTGDWLPITGVVATLLLLAAPLFRRRWDGREQS
ncbi:MAG: apolipoprotein N-acyltransferase [Blastocatellia bacterium]